MAAHRRTYPAGVTSWIDVEQPDVDAAADFYRGLLGWDVVETTDPGAPARYLIATLDGQEVAGLGSPAPGKPRWNTYVAVDDADTASSRVVAAGGRLVDGPTSVGPSGRTATCTDPQGLEIRLWEAGRLLGAQLTNAPGAWNFSNLHTADRAAAERFYGDVFGWSFDDLGFAVMIRVPGYGDHLAATTDPGIHERQSGVGVPPGFADAIGWVAEPTDAITPQWHVTITVDDRDAVAARAESLGATILSAGDSDWTHDAVVRDPQGAVFTASQFDPSGTG